MDVQTHADPAFFLNDISLDDIDAIIARDENPWSWEREELVSTNRTIFTDCETYNIIIESISPSSSFSPDSQVSPISPVTPVTVQRISSIDTDECPEDFTPVINDDEKKLKRREQNRKAAKTCREKKKKLADQSIQEYQQASCENTKLQYLLNQAKRERDHLNEKICMITNTCPQKSLNLTDGLY